jgi:hypothetical protein
MVDKYEKDDTVMETARGRSFRAAGTTATVERVFLEVICGV